MIDWRGRIDELMAHLQREYKVEDRAAVEILLASLIECPHTATLWQVIETNWWNYQATHAWFGFGGYWHPLSFSWLRDTKSWSGHTGNLYRHGRDQLIADILEKQPQEKQLIFESEYEYFPPRLYRLPSILFYLDRALHVRTRTTRTQNQALATIDLEEQFRRVDRLRAVTSQVVEDRVGARPEKPAVFQPPPNFNYHLELVQRMSPFYRDWDQLLVSFGALGVRHAHLYGRAEMAQEDWQILARVAADSVPFWVHKTLKVLVGVEGVTTKQLHVHMRAGEGLATALAELQRLEKGDLIRSQGRTKSLRWSINRQHSRAIELILSERAFAATEQAASR